MHAHVNIWTLNDAGNSGSDRISRQMAELLREQPGFHSYSVIRTGDQEVVVVTMFESAAQLHSAFEAISGQVRENIEHVSSGSPETRNGDVLFHLDRYDEGERRQG